MIILGIDYGTKRIGLAISDETETLARELEIVESKSIWSRLQAILEQDRVEKIVVGLPLNMEGQETQKTEEAQNFAKKIKEKFSVEVETMDERLSSQMAEGISGQQNDLDSLAAQIILQNYLNKNKN